MGVLLLLSLVLITVSFRESSTGALHGAEGAAATVLRPFEVGAERVARPFRDVYGYFRGLVHAKRENNRLRAEVDKLRQEVIQNQSALRQNAGLKTLLRYVDSPSFPADYAAVNTRIISRAPSEFVQQVEIAAGSDSGIGIDAPVVTQDGLVGRVTEVSGSVAQVTLVTDPESAVQAEDQFTGADGLVRHGAGQGSLILDRVGKDKNIQEGDVIVTAGTRSKDYPSLYPRGIPIGQVTFVGQSDTAIFKQIQIQPYVDFGSLDSVTVLVRRTHVRRAP